MPRCVFDRWLVGLALLGSALLSPAFAQQAEPTAELTAKIARAIQDLGADAFETRNAAQAELQKIGLPAEQAVTAAARSPDPEIAGRARIVLAELARKKLDVELEKVTWATVLERVKHHASNDDWKKPGFADSLLEQAVEKVIDQANKGAKADRVQLPVRFADVTAAEPGVRRGLGPREGTGQLVCGQGSLEFGRGERSIFLVDGSVRVAYANNCLIIARGAVNISHGSGNVVLAGQFIDISHEGSARRARDPAAADPGRGWSLILSGGILRISHASGAICSAPEEVSVGADECIFLNCTPRGDFTRRGNNQVIEKVSLQLQPIATPNPIRDRLQITQVVDRGDSAGFIVVEHNGVEVVVRQGSELKDNLGQPVPGLAGWKLAFAATGYALLSNGKEDAGFVVTKK